MAWYDAVLDVLQKPLGATAGAANYLSGNEGRQQEWARDYEATKRRGSKTSEQDDERYEAIRRRLGTDDSDEGFLGGLWDAINRGGGTEMTYSDVGRMGMGGRDGSMATTANSKAAQGGMMALDLLADPMNALGGVGKGAKAVDALDTVGKLGQYASKIDDIPVLGKFIEGASTVGKIGTDTQKAGLAAKAGQYARRGYQGMQLTRDPMSALHVAGLIGGGERIGMGLAGRLGRKAVAKGLEEGAAAAPVEQAEEMLKGATPARIDMQTDPNWEFAQDAMQRRLGLEAGPQSVEATYERYIPELENSQGPLPPELENFIRGELPKAPRPHGGIPGQPPYDESLNSLLGKRQKGSLFEGQRDDAVLRSMLESGRSGKGRFLNPENRNIIEIFMQNPDAMQQVLRQYRNR